MEDLRATVEAYLDARFVLSLATTGPDGPWAASLYFAREGLRLYFFSDPDSRHSQNIEANPAVAATINEDEHDWRRIRGIQLEGVARRLTSEADVEAASEAYLRKFPFVQGMLEKPADIEPGMAEKISSTTLYEITPTRVLFIDNSRGFGYREELSLRDEGGPSG